MIARMRSLVCAVVTAALATAGAGRAIADEAVPGTPPPVGGSLGFFGERGEIALSADIPFGGPALNIVHSSTTMGGGSATAIQIQPALDYFVSPNVSVGATVTLDRTSVSFDTGAGTTTTGTQTLIGLGPRVGYNIVLSGTTSLWIRGTVAYQHVSSDFGAGPSTSGYTVVLGAVAEFLWHPVSHFFLGIGPALATEVIAKQESMDVGKTTQFGLVSTIGGYFGGL